MGRPRIELDDEIVLDLVERGLSQKEIAAQLGVSVPTLAKKIAELQTKQGVLLKYRTLQSLQLTELQAKVLSYITEEKLAEASLRDLILAYKILKDKEQTIEGQPSEIKGLVGYLIHMEKERLLEEEKEDELEAQSDSLGKVEAMG